MIFARRALQRRLDELRPLLGVEAVKALADRMNRLTRDRISAEWEVVIIHALSKVGEVKYEEPISSGSRPDVLFSSDGFNFIADIATVSDEGGYEKNPVYDVWEAIGREKGRVGLPLGGVDVRVLSRSERKRKGTITSLRLPPRAQISSFLRTEVFPVLKRQMDSGHRILSVVIDNDGAGLEIKIDTAGSRFSCLGFSEFLRPRIVDSNVVYNTLKRKYKQVICGDICSGVVVTDGGCAVFSPKSSDLSVISPREIAREFLRQHSSVAFVLFLSVFKETTASYLSVGQREFALRYELVCRDVDRQEALAGIFEKMVGLMPKAIEAPVNAFRNAALAGYGLGNHGAYSIVKDNIRISSRELVEALAGVNRPGVLTGQGGGSVADAVLGRFLMMLQQGRLPTAVRVCSGGENEDDDWVEIEFGSPDPAISPFR